MRKVDTVEYISALRTLAEEGKEVGLPVSGSSMTPFLAPERDYICFQKPEREPKTGDMVFYQRDSGQFVMHRIYRVKADGYYMVGDAQTEIEGPLRREQIFGIVTKVRRKGKWLQPGDFWWEFFEKIWVHMVPFRKNILWLYRKVIR